jgi:hypothetical protein
METEMVDEPIYVSVTSGHGDQERTNFEALFERLTEIERKVDCILRTLKDTTNE